MKRILVIGLAAIGFVATSGLAQAQDLVWKLDNQSSNAINYIYLSSPDAEDWGDDILGAEEVVPPGQVYTVTITNAGDMCEFDTQFIMSTKQTIEQLGVNICDGLVTTITDTK